MSFLLKEICCPRFLRNRKSDIKKQNYQKTMVNTKFLIAQDSSSFISAVAPIKWPHNQEQPRSTKIKQHLSRSTKTTRLKFSLYLSPLSSYIFSPTIPYHPNSCPNLFQFSLPYSSPSHSVLQWVRCRQDLRVSPSQAWLGERIMTSDSQLDQILSLRSTGQAGAAWHLAVVGGLASPRLVTY